MLTILAVLPLVCGCRSVRRFDPQWLSDPSAVIYSSEYEGNVRVKLKAKITEGEFFAVTEKMKMIPHTEDPEYAANLEVLGWKRGPDKQWNPLPSIERTFLFHRMHLWEIAKYENGLLYYQLLTLEE